MTLEGTEKTTVYEEQPDGKLNKIKTKEIKAGEVLELAPDAVRSVKNPGDSQTRFFQCCLGDIRKLNDECHVWDWKTQEMSYSEDNLVKQGVGRMSSNKNQEGLTQARGGSSIHEGGH